MSTKIYNGYKLPSMSLMQTLRFCKAFRDKVRKRAESLYGKRIIALATDIFDRLTLNLPVEEIEKKGCAFVAAFSHSCKQIAEVRKTGMRNTDWDFMCDVTLIPTPRKILALLFTEQESFRKIWRDLDGVEEYGYWDNTDQPESITEQEWHQRGKDWDKYLGYDAPCVAGLTISCFGSYDGPPPPKLNKIIPKMLAVKFDERVRRQAIAILRDKRFQQLKPKWDAPSDVARFLDGFKEWVENEEGKAAFADTKLVVASKLKEQLTKDDLLQEFTINRK
jgi:hypothetical protein